MKNGGVLRQLFRGFERIRDHQPDGCGVTAEEFGEHGAASRRADAGVLGAGREGDRKKGHGNYGVPTASAPEWERQWLPVQPGAGRACREIVIDLGFS